jgi:Cu2+-exporting ATPase
VALVQVGLAIGTYAGLRLWERVRRRRSLRQCLRPVVTGNRCARRRGAGLRDDEATPRRLAARSHELNAAGWALTLSVGTYGLPWLMPAAVAVNIYAMLGLLRAAEHSLLHRGAVRDDLLSSIVCVASLGLGQPLPAAVQSWSYHYADVTVLRSRDRARRLLAEAAPPAAEVRLLKAGVEVARPAGAARPGDLALLRTGDLVPVDGRVRTGSLAVDQQRLTGESAPRLLGPGDEVLAGTLVLRGEAVVEVTRSGRGTVLARMEQSLRRSADYTSGLQLKAERLADAAALPLLVVSGAAWPVIGPSAAVGILFSAPVNAVRAAGAAVTAAHLGALLNDGILVKDGRALEAMADLDTLLFDKTGTLTADGMTVTEVTGLGDWDEARILGAAAAAEGELHHPIARALMAAAARAPGGAPLPAATETLFRVGFGVTATIAGERVLVGGRRHLAAAGIGIDPAAETALGAAEGRGATAILVATEAGAQGVIAIEASTRTEARAVVDALRRGGIRRITLVSGDSNGPSRALADAMGLDDCASDMLPADKARLVQHLQQAGHRVGFVGDGVNDALAMQRANCAVSLHGASALATDTAGIILLDSNLTRLPGLLAGARDQQAQLRQVLGYWGLYGVVNLGLNVGLRIGALPSSLFFGVALGAGLLSASRPARSTEATP